MRKVTYPIKSLSTLQALHTYLLTLASNATTTAKKSYCYRNWLYFALGINLGFRGGDLSELTWGQLITKTPNGYLIRNDDYNLIQAEKTGKYHLIVLNEEAQSIIRFYIKVTTPLGVSFSPDSPVFFSKKSKGTSEATVSGHVDCDSIGRILKAAAKAVGIKQNICTHSLRKTFGYHYFKATGDVITLQKIFGHSSPAITLSYIGMDSEEIAAAYQAKPNTCIDLEQFCEPCGAELKEASYEVEDYEVEDYEVEDYEVEDYEVATEPFSHSTDVLEESGQETTVSTSARELGHKARSHKDKKHENHENRENRKLRENREFRENRSHIPSPNVCSHISHPCSPVDSHASTNLIPFVSKKKPLDLSKPNGYTHDVANPCSPNQLSAYSEHRYNRPYYPKAMGYR